MTNEEYFKSQEFRDILSDYERCEEQGLPCILGTADYCDIADYYQMDGNMERARYVIEQAMALYPGESEPLLFRARLALIDGDKESARQYAQQMTDKQDTAYYTIAAELLIADDRAEEANQYLREKLDVVDEEVEMDFIFDVASIFHDYGYDDFAQDWIEQHEDLDDADVLELKAKILAGVGEDDESEEIYQHLLDKNPFSVSYWNQLADLQFQRDRLQEAISSAEFSIALNPDDAEAVLIKANSLYGMANYGEALPFFARYAELCPERETGEMFQGICLMCLDKYEEAIQHLKKAEAVEQKFPTSEREICQELALSLAYTGRFDEAFDYVTKAEQQPDCDRNDMLVLRGHFYLLMGNQQKAVECFIHAFRRSHGAYYILHHICISIFDCGNKQMAYSFMKSYIDTPRNTRKEGYAYLAACCLDMEMREEFLHYLKIAVETSPGEARNILGEYFPLTLNPEEYYDYAKQNML